MTQIIATCGNIARRQMIKKQVLLENFGSIINQRIKDMEKSKDPLKTIERDSNAVRRLKS